jgi:hypothetical protein
MSVSGFRWRRRGRTADSTPDSSHSPNGCRQWSITPPYRSGRILAAARDLVPLAMVGRLQRPHPDMPARKRPPAPASIVRRSLRAVARGLASSRLESTSCDSDLDEDGELVVSQRAGIWHGTGVTHTVPPFTRTFCAVIQRPPSLARNATTAAISSGRPRRPNADIASSPSRKPLVLPMR